jgi:ketosteroid isomerase-like protein
MTMSTSTTQTFDFVELKRALEERDATAQLALYADDAEVRLVDRINTPGAPRVLRGREEIRGWIEDICERDMTHRVEMQVVGDGGAAFTEACRYPDGTNVLCAAVLELRDGRIARELGVQAWDA